MPSSATRAAAWFPVRPCSTARSSRKLEAAADAGWPRARPGSRDRGCSSEPVAAWVDCHDAADQCLGRGRLRRLPQARQHPQQILLARRQLQHFQAQPLGRRVSPLAAGLDCALHKTTSPPRRTWHCGCCAGAPSPRPRRTHATPCASHRTKVCAQSSFWARVSGCRMGSEHVEPSSHASEHRRAGQSINGVAPQRDCVRRRTRRRRAELCHTTASWRLRPKCRHLQRPQVSLQHQSRGGCGKPSPIGETLSFASDAPSGNL